MNDMKKKNIAKIIVLLLSFLVPAGLSDWIYLNETSTIEAGNEDKCTVSVHQRLQKQDVVTDNSSNKKTVKEEKVEDSGTAFKHKEVGDVIKEASDVKTVVGEIVDGAQETTVTFQKTIVTKVDANFLQTKFTYTYSTYEWTVVTKRYLPVDTSSFSLKVQRGHIISPFDLILSESMQYEYYSDSSYSTLFDFSKPITGDVNIYLLYRDGVSSLTTYINEKTSGTYSVYDGNRGGSSGSYNVFDDFAYETNGKFDYLGAATISSGVTINFVYLDNRLYPSPNTGAIADGDATDHRDTKANVALDYYNNQYIGNNNCSLMIRLNGDLTVKGTLNIGAKVGSVAADKTYSQIIGNYTQLDLNGHNLIVDGGTLNCYGSIVDRIGGGKVLVKNSGTLMGLLNVTDGRGGNQTTYGYGKGQSPFDEYRFTYIEAPIEAMHGTTLKGYLKLDLGSLGLSNIYANIVGPSGSSVFSWGTKRMEDDRIEIVPYINTNLYPTDVSKQEKNKIYLNMYYYRYKYVFNANVVLNSKIPLKARINFKDLKKEDVDIDWARIGVPIPPFFDLLLKSTYSLTLKAKLLLLPGSSFVSESNSTLTFDPGEVMTYPDVSISVKILVYKVEVYIKGETTRNRGGLMAYDRSFYTYNASTHVPQNKGVYALYNYWKYTKPSNHMVLGNVEIRDIPDSYKYLISGPISFSKESIQSILGSSDVQTYDIKGEQNGSLWFSPDYPTYESSVNLITSFNALPLISNGFAYIKDASLNLKGTFDSTTRLFKTDNDKKYFLYTKNDFLQGGSAPENQNALTDYDVTPTLVDGEINNQIIKASNAYYVNYKGVFVPVLDSLTSGTTYANLNANIRKFCSNNNTALYSNSTKYDKAKLKFDTSTKMWVFDGFAS